MADNVPTLKDSVTFDACPFCHTAPWDTTIVLWTGRRSVACNNCADHLTNSIDVVYGRVTGHYA